MTDGRRDIAVRVPMLARVEGEGALHLAIRDDAITDLRLEIFEPPRLFEKFLEGRSSDEVPDIVARICGICPVAYQMSAVHAIESCFDLDTGDPARHDWIRAMRRVIYCGEWIESHSLHVHLLALPDFLGFASVADMAQDWPDEVRRGLRLQTLGNDLIRLLGARSVHPVGVRVGGFHRAPDSATVAALRDRLQAAIPEAEALLRWLAALDLPRGEQPFTCVALRHAEEYPMNAGRLVSNRGLDIDIAQYADHFSEFQVPHSTALHAHLYGEPYLVGPLARLNLNHDRLPAPVSALLAECGITLPSYNMFHSIIARAVEILYALHEASRLLQDYQAPQQPWVAATPRAGVCYGCSEAPRGILWMRYEFDAQGLVRSARIVPPTSQNQARIEADLHASLLALGLDSDEEALRLRAEQVIRNYDPCISCSTHFLRLNVARS